MDVAHYSLEAAHFAAELVNTKGSITGRELVADVEAWNEFLRPYAIEGLDELTERDIDQIKIVRERLKEVFFADQEGAIERINSLLRDVAATPQIATHDDQPWHMHYSAAEAPLADRIAAGAAMGLALLITEQGFERLGVCAADECRDVYVDTSRNRSRRYCNQTCSTKVNVAAHRARKKESGVT